MNRIATVSTQVPKHRYDRKDILATGDAWLSEHPEEKQLFARYVQSAAVESRHFALPVEKILELNGTHSRAEAFQREGYALARNAVEGALEQSGLRAQDIDTLVFTSCSIPSIPSLDTYLIDSMGFSRSVRRIPIYQYGCVGGAAGLSLAASFAERQENVLLLSVETCSLIYQRGDFNRSSLIGSALFGDGAACAVLRPYGLGTSIRASQSYLLPESSHLMGYDILDDGTHLILDKELPSRLIDALPKIVETFLAENKLSTTSISSWLFHPGGPKILESLESIFSLQRDQLLWSWQVLRDFGNMSSASILFVLSQYLADVRKTRGPALMLGIGPGLTVELLLLDDPR